MSHEDSTCEELFADPDEVVAFAQAYYATEFPNSERRGCPPAEMLRKVASSGTLPDAQLRAHLFACSECFRSFRSARISYRPQAAATENRRGVVSGLLANLFTPKRALIGATAAGAALMITVAVSVWRARVEPVNIAMNTQPQEMAVPAAQMTAPAATAPAVTSESPPSAPRVAGVRRTRDVRPQGARRSSPTTQTAPSRRVLEIDLQEENLMRGADAVVGKPGLISLAPQRQRLRLQLSEGSAGGRYTVSVVDAFGKPLVTTPALSNGRTLTVDLDLRSLAAKRYRLCVTRDGESPDCYLVSVSEQAGRAVK